MKAHRYDTYCGLYCGACEVMNAGTDQEKVRFIRAFEGNLPDWHATPEQVHCSGCKTEDVFVNCSKCPIRPCAKSRGVEFCIECSEFPCQIYHHLQMASDQIPILQHLKAIVRNQKYIKAHGVEKWLDDQKSKWECPECKTRFSWYTQECKSCKRDLSGIKDYEASSGEDIAC